MARIDIPGVEAIIKEVAQAEIMPRFRKLMDGDIEMKGINDPVTVADKAAELALIKRLTLHSPGSVVVGEESFAADNNLLEHFNGSEDVWVLDPIDGTRNFIEGKAEFAVMVALVRNKKTIAAWIHDPNTDDTLTAETGAGVWLRKNKMRLAGQDEGGDTVGLVGLRLKKFFARPEIASKLREFPPLVVGSAAAFDYAQMFTGAELFAKSSARRASFLPGYRKAMPWDHLAGLMMIHEAGGYSTDWNGDRYNANNPYRGLFSASSRALWEKMFSSIQGDLKAELAL